MTTQQDLIGKFRDEIRREAQEWDAQIETLARQIGSLRRQISSSLADWDRQLSLLSPPKTSLEDSERQINYPGNVSALGDENKASESLHRDAIRYARLLISEIELYNSEQVAQGRTNRDLYSRLRQHIERSRRAFESRFAQQEIQSCFHQELVHSLAGGDPSLLGPDYPVQSE